MLLAVDIGNTHTVIGLFRDWEMWDSWRISSDPMKTEDEYAILISNLLATEGHGMREIKALVLSSTVPALTDIWHQLTNKYFDVEPLIVNCETDIGMPLKVDNPKMVGADRIVNGVAAIRKYGTNLIVVDLGTATTFDCISKDGEYIGGAIAPGVAVSAEALAQKAAKLPNVQFAVPEKVLSPNTTGALQSGIVYGFAGQIDGIVKRLKAEMGGEVKVIATGGLADKIAPVCESVDEVDLLLTLRGLNLIFRRSIGKA
ncbi:MAG: type III pantothenate kinase [Bacillota bacterium]|jgi:type III pantothenate kinase